MKKRIIPSVLLNSGTNVSLSRKFEPWRTVGTLLQQLRLHVSRECDELLIINLNSCSSDDFSLPHRILSLVRREVNVPISYVGGIKDAVSASECINAGFDKVFVTSAYFDDPSCINEITSVIGVQSLGVCLPYSRDTNSSSAFLWDFRTRTSLQYSLLEHIAYLDHIGVGEILLYNVDQDGSMQGMDERLLDELQTLSLNTPVLLSGGAGTPTHVENVLSSNLVQGVVASSIFSLTEHTPFTLRSQCISSGIPMRIP